MGKYKAISVGADKYLVKQPHTGGDTRDHSGADLGNGDMEDPSSCNTNWARFQM